MRTIPAAERARRRSRWGAPRRDGVLGIVLTTNVCQVFYLLPAIVRLLTTIFGAAAGGLGVVGAQTSSKRACRTWTRW